MATKKPAAKAKKPAAKTAKAPAKKPAAKKPAPKAVAKPAPKAAAKVAAPKAVASVAKLHAVPAPKRGNAPTPGWMNDAIKLAQQNPAVTLVALIVGALGVILILG